MILKHGATPLALVLVGLVCACGADAPSRTQAAIEASCRRDAECGYRDVDKCIGYAKFLVESEGRRYGALCAEAWVLYLECLQFEQCGDTDGCMRERIDTSLVCDGCTVARQDPNHCGPLDDGHYDSFSPERARDGDTLIDLCESSPDGTCTKSL